MADKCLQMFFLPCPLCVHGWSFLFWCWFIKFFHTTPLLFWVGRSYLCYGWNSERPHDGNWLVPTPWKTSWSFVMLRLSFHFLKYWSFRVLIASPCFLSWLCIEIAQSLIDELDSLFPSHEVLDAFGILLPTILGARRRRGLFSSSSCSPKEAILSELDHSWEGWRCNFPGAPNLLISKNLDHQQALSKTTMKSNYTPFITWIISQRCGEAFHHQKFCKIWFRST